MRYEQNLAQLLGMISKFKVQIDEVKEAGKKVISKLNSLKNLHEQLDQPEIE